VNALRLRLVVCFIAVCFAALSEAQEEIPSERVKLRSVEGLTTWPESTFYWRNVAGEAYDEAFVSDFDYARAHVELFYEKDSRGTFRARIAAKGLKPDFCYQVKLVGNAEIDRATMERIGYAGRWWRERPEPNNSSDADYNEHKDDGAYEFKSYLPFDFFVTESRGEADVEFAAESSYHVFWKVSQRAPQGKDGPVRTYEVGGKRVDLYGEWEPGRALPGTLVLPPGSYRAELLLTEESFHELTPGWAAALTTGEIEFVVEALQQGT